ncbi:MAG TPA: hypothetical protein VK498_08560 [Ferruginibacter sp.]|nr:hypothetical protein [Ferruginibacter sp.]
MKKRVIIVLKLLCIFSVSLYSQSNYIDTPCIENKRFKIKYFKCINDVEAYARYQKNADSVYVSQEVLKKSLNAIGIFVEVDWTLLGNYAYNYANISQFLEQKKKWLDWYKNNKCKNLKWP